MRDALSLLDQVLAFAGDRVDISDVHTVTGSLGEEKLSEILAALVEGDAATALDYIESLVTDGLEPERLIHELIHAARDVLLLLTAPELEEVKERLAGRETLMRLSDQVSREQLVMIMDGLLEYQQQMKWAAHPRILLELAIVQIAQGSHINEGEESSAVVHKLQERLQGLERKVAELASKLDALTSTAGAATSMGAKQVSSSPTSERKKVVIPGQIGELLKAATPEQLQKVKRGWPEVLNRVKEQKITVHAWLVDGEPVAATEQAVTRF